MQLLIRECNNLQYEEFRPKVSEIDKKYFPVDFDYRSVNYFNVHRPRELILKFQSRYSEFPMSSIDAALNLAIPDEEIISTKPLYGSGTGHIICNIETKKSQLIFRANWGLEQPEEYMVLEEEFLKWYKELGIPVNALLFADVSRRVVPYDFQVMRVLPGFDLKNEFNGTEADFNNISLQQGRFNARLLNKVGKGWGRIKKDENGDLVGYYSTHNEFLTAFLLHDLEVIKAFGIIDDEILEKVYSYFLSSNIKELFSDTLPHLIHNDPSDLNLRHDGKNLVAFFDWENAVMFDPINEIATAPTWQSVYPKSEQLIQGYIEELGYTPKNLNEKIAVYYLRKALDKVAFALKGERLSQRHLDLLKRGLEINRL